MVLGLVHFGDPNKIIIWPCFFVDLAVLFCWWPFYSAEQVCETDLTNKVLLVKTITMSEASRIMQPDILSCRAL